jgi:hypothetical protein
MRRVAGTALVPVGGPARPALAREGALGPKLHADPVDMS